MSPSDLVGYVAVLVLVAVACFIAFRALQLRRALVDRSYRSRALWTAIGSLTLVAFAVSDFYPQISNEPATYSGVIAEAVFYGFIFIGLYGWMISNADVAVGADYYNRDILFWKKGGRNTVLVMIVVGFVLFNLPPWWFAGPSATYVMDVATVFGYLLTVVPIAYVIIVLPISYRRIMDRRIKSYTVWVALSIASVFVAIFLSGPLALVLFVAFLYFMYRAVGSLAIRTSSLSGPGT